MRLFKILILSSVCLWTNAGRAQFPETKVTWNYQQARLAHVLAGIKSKHGISFSYANNLIPLDKKLNLTVKEMPLESAFQLLCKEAGISYSLVGKQVVLRKETAKPVKKTRLEKTPNLPKEPPARTGPVPSEATPHPPGEPEPEGTVTASLLPVPALSETDEQENRLETEYQSEERQLRKNFVSQMDAALDFNDGELAENLKREYKKLKANLKSEYNTIRESFRRNKPATNPADSVQNQNGSVQVSVIPPFSSNGAHNAEMENRLSLNILAGYAGGLNGVEVGGIANMERENARGVQVAGLANLVQGNVEGVQAAGFINLNGKHLEGTQVAGFMNTSGSDSSHAVQLAGFSNIHAGDLMGTQASGFINVNGGYLVGPQLAGFLNIARGPVLGAQCAGFMNLNAGNLQGVQAAGFINVADKNLKGSQVAGFMNFSGKTLRGVQAAGFLNVGNKVHGSQVGFINLADSVSGVQVGIINFSRKGYRRIEVYAMERIQANLTFKLGTRHFHTIFSGGINPQEKNPLLSYGLGFGSEFGMGRKGNLNLDLVCNRIFDNKDKFTEQLNLLNQLKISFGYHPWKRTTLFAGPTFNVVVSRVKSRETGEIGSAYIPDWATWDTISGPTRIALWPGFQAGIRF